MGVPRRRSYPGGGKVGGLTQEKGKEEGLPRRRVRRRAYPGGERTREDVRRRA